MTTIPHFYEILFSSLAGQLIEVRQISPAGWVQTVFYESTGELVEAISKTFASDRCFNHFFGVCPRVRKSGTKKDITHVPALWVDMDAKDFKDGKPEALTHLHKFPLAPTAIVDSGHGYHGYWFLKDPEEITGPADVARVEGYLRGLAKALKGDLKAAEIARVLRIPGTANIKDPAAPVPAAIIEFNPGVRVNLSDLDFAILTDLPGQEDKPNPPGWVSVALSELHEGNRNGTFAKVAGRLHRDGWVPDDIVTLLKPHAERSGFSSEELEREVEGICARYPVGNSSQSLPHIGGDTETGSPPLRAVRLTNFLAENDAPVDWVVEGVLPREGVGILSGPGGYGKSWMLSDLALEVPRGGKWLGHFPTFCGRVLYIDEESSKPLLSQRLRKLLSAKGLTGKEADVHLMVGSGTSLGNQASVERLRQLLEELRPDLVVLDSLIRLHRAEENSASEMAWVFHNVRTLVREFGCAFVFADHQRKPGPFGGNLDLALRGTSEKVAFVDSLLSLHRKKGELIVEHSKSRYAQPVPSFVIRIEDIGPNSTRVEYVGEADEVEQTARLENAVNLLEVELASGEWVSRATLMQRGKEDGVTEKALDDALKALHQGKLIDREDRKPETGRGGKSAFYRWKPEAESKRKEQ